MTSAAIERRVAPRFAISRVGELASGNAVVSVRISDMSVTGCGIELVDDVVQASDSLGRTGVLSVPPSGPSSSGVMLPVVISNHRLDGGRSRLGLQFRRLSMLQMRSLIGVLDSAIDK